MHRDRAMIQDQPMYMAYLLRLWQVQDAQGMTWRVSLEEVNTHTLRGFRNLEHAMMFLQERTTAQPSNASSFRRQPKGNENSQRYS